MNQPMLQEVGSTMFMVVLNVLKYLILIGSHLGFRDLCWRVNYLELDYNILENSQTLAKWLETKHNSKGGGGTISLVTLMWMWENSIGMTPYFSSGFRVLGISKNILFLLDILAIIQFLFHQRSPSIKRAIIFISYFDLLILKNAKISQTQLVYTFTLSIKISSKSVQ